MPKLPDLSEAAVLKRQALAEVMRAEREAAPPPPPPRQKIRIAASRTGTSRAKKQVH